MNPRERTLAFILLAVIVLMGGGLLFYTFFWRPIQARDAALATLRKNIADKEKKVGDLEPKKAQIDHWRAVSLPGDLHFAWGEYQKYLNDQLAESGFTPGAMNVKSREPAAAGGGARNIKKPPFTLLSYEVSGSGKLQNLVRLLDRLYRAPLLHQIKSIDIKRADAPRPGQAPDELDFALKIEAVIVEGAPKRTTLLPKENVPEVKVLARAKDRYDAIAGKNIFLPPAPEADFSSVKTIEVTRYVHLADITRNDTRVEAFLYDRYNNRKTRLRAESGFNKFRVADNHDETMVRGQVVRIEERDLIFKADEKFYRLHMEETIQEAMRKPLTDAELKDMKLVAAKAD